MTEATEDTNPAGGSPLERRVRQHTQDGEWVDAGLTGDNPLITGGPLRLVKCEGVVIAFMPAWLDDAWGEAQANARLVSAAPDLLDALKRMVESITGVDQVSAVNEARAAIEKATGCAA